MTKEPTDWQPIGVEAIQELLGTFRDWYLAGGQSLDWIVGRTTRQHGDTDIGVFRSNLRSCLEAIGSHRVFLCDGKLIAWDGNDLPMRVHDIWISDPLGQHWVLQIMVYDEAGEEVVYRRDPRIRWAKALHSVCLRGVRIVNPVVTLLFKLNKAKLESKDCHDVQVLIEELANKITRANHGQP